MIKLTDILLELTGERSTREQFGLGVSRNVINAFKSGVSRYKDYLTLPRGGEEAEVNLDIQFIKRPKQEYAFSIAAGFGPTKSEKTDALEMKIEYNPKQFPNAMNAFVAEIKETLEHELEHVGQQNFEDMYIVSNRYDQPLAYPEDSPQAPSHFLYLTSNREVPAYVKGLLKRAKVKKMTFEQVLEDYYNDYRDTFALYKTDWSKVKRIWLDWAIANKDKLRKIT
jgi:hypothetical protein